MNLHALLIVSTVRRRVTLPEHKSSPNTNDYAWLRVLVCVRV